MPSVLIVDDHAALREGLLLTLRGQGYEAVAAGDGAGAMEACRKRQVDLCLLDHRLPGSSGLEVLREIKAASPETEVILMTAFGTIDLAVEALRAGASDFLQKPFPPEELLVRLRLTERNAASRRKAQALEEASAAEEPGLVFRDPRLEALMEKVEKVAPTEATVLIQGESGTGKEMVAARIHRLSPRSGMPFVKVNCAALAEGVLESELFGHEKGAFTGAVPTVQGKVEYASGGTLFLDEIGELSAPVQVKLLRFLQEHEFQRLGGNQTLSTDVRVISATNRDLEQRVKEGAFREDLFYRLNVVMISIPPLRERKEDIPALIDYFLKRYADENGKRIKGLSSEAQDVLLKYDYPGNVRELENIIERAVVIAREEMIFEEDLPFRNRPAAEPESRQGEEGMLRGSVEELEKRLIVEAMEKTGDHQSRAADLLGISERMLRYKLKKYGLKAL